MHVSVDPEQVGDSWKIVLPILLANDDTIKMFKVTDMDVVGRSLETDKARRVYYGDQITIYLHATPPKEGEAAHRLAKVMKVVSQALKSARIRPGKQLNSELPVNEYVSFRHAFRDLIEPESCKAWREKCVKEGTTEEQYTGGIDLLDSHERYGDHMTLMKDRPLYLELLKSQ